MLHFVSNLRRCPQPDAEPIEAVRFSDLEKTSPDERKLLPSQSFQFVERSGPVGPQQT
jgi:hypothetical protein